MAEKKKVNAAKPNGKPAKAQAAKRSVKKPTPEPKRPELEKKPGVPEAAKKPDEPPAPPPQLPIPIASFIL